MYRTNEIYYTSVKCSTSLAGQKCSSCLRLFCVAGVFLLHQGLNISVTGIPKTIDNDLDIIDRSFGFLTAVEVGDTHETKQAKIKLMTLFGGRTDGDDVSTTVVVVEGILVEA